MRKFILISVILTGLIGCSSDDGTTNPTTTNQELIGIWATLCELDTATTSVQAAVEFDETNVTLTVTGYSDTNCQTTMTMAITPFTYTLGGTAVLDGSVAGLTSGTEFNLVPDILSAPTFFSVLALSGNTLYLGDDADPVNDGSSDAKRLAILDSGALIQQ